MTTRPQALSGDERQLFAEALERTDAAERAALRARACAGRPGLRERLEALLRASVGAETLFSTPGYEGAPAAGCEAEAKDYLTQIGQYRLRSRIGEGGCGVVYLAEQQEPVRRLVALKVIRLGMDTEQVIRRFEAERQSLALMEHPCIARVLDAGATDSGRPFFVMERVEGVRITDYCAQHRLPLGARLELFIQVCQGIQHAHGKGVIHRDIKPSNLLVAEVDGKPFPKIIDFGIAKATGSDPAGQTLHTAELGALLGSPAYMSPEHACPGGLEIDTRSDVFSLGVVLCELLIGAAPFAACEWQRLGPDEIRHQVRTREARRPSQVFSDSADELRRERAAQRGLSPARLQAAVAGELDWVVLKALAKDRDRRYATAAALADDLRRHLAHDVVEARPPSRLYHLGKAVARHKGPVLAAALVLLSLAAGLGVALRLYGREQRALAAQIELRREAEQARANEAALRERAEAGERIARAAVQVSYQRLPEADALVADLPAQLVQPSLEAALVFRTLGTWHARAERWPQAARYLGAFASSITEIDPSDVTGVSGDLIPAAAAIVEAGRTEDYEQFRRLLLRRFADTRQVVVAEQAMKSCLLAPVTAEVRAGLAPWRDLITQSCATPNLPEAAYMHAWRCFCLGLLEYRSGNPAAAPPWLERALAVENPNDAREAAIRLVKALARVQLGQRAEAQADLSRADELLRAHAGAIAQSPPADPPPPYFHGYWFDWVINRALRREFAALAQATDAPHPR